MARRVVSRYASPALHHPVTFAHPFLRFSAFLTAFLPPFQSALLWGFISYLRSVCLCLVVTLASPCPPRIQVPSTSHPHPHIPSHNSLTPPFTPKWGALLCACRLMLYLSVVPVFSVCNVDEDEQ
ncbi:hypothetical protein M407DRAFT_197562 [Tulasnella calospora MUT 4182]|uniref:Uncharacterized protein n=1 Tax=Tulasnella calospora MUT 4182 TaxID=1051891 RepID=A0A0C3KZG9_9AGAM|nr:hypothetical protein M407DRAFT_197562 [Tulasnella calospora MUT 4182]